MDSKEDISSQKRKASTPIFSLYGSDDEDANGETGDYILDTEPKRIRSEELDGEMNSVPFYGGSIDSEKSAAESFLLSVCAARKGEREDMQDRHLLIDSLQSQMESLLALHGVKGRFAFYALFDGHAGEHASDYCAKNFVHKFVEVSRECINGSSEIALLEKSIKKIFNETYKAVDDQFLNEARKSKPTLRDGTTSTTILLLNETIISANVGDSKAVICRYKPDEKQSIAIQLTIDHSPMIFAERMRIQKAGGSVKFLILACDGLWKSFTPDSAINFVLDCFKRRTASNSKEDETSLWSYIADEICANAIRRGCRLMTFNSKIPIAEINKENIYRVWPQLLNAIQHANLVAVDLEFSGLGDSSNKKTFHDRYKIAKETVKSRTILSMGIATFQRRLANDPRNVSYKCKATSRENIFKSIFEEILASGVSLAVHNGFNDLLFIYEHFYASLPDSVDEFVANIADWFGIVDGSNFVGVGSPTILDSKYLALKNEEVCTN
uniref:PPM-type phosphatase domain-containing protein n=1 Tax=Meloidogyne hapla TaxID=6305 RepID=A0A1I8BNQ6_MELHA